jgi:RimJ/RimL family protein N-acetyltransferase
MTQPVLRSERLVLEPLASEHLMYDIQLASDPEVMRYLGGPTLSRSECERAHSRRIAMADIVDGLGHWMAFAADPPGLGSDNPRPSTAARVVGLMMLPPAHGPDQPDDPGVADLGYRLVRQAWGHGYGLEGTHLLLTHAFDTLGLSRVIAQTRSDNQRSRRLLAVVGLRFVRSFRSLDNHSDGPLDVEYEITRSEWDRRA